MKRQLAIHNQHAGTTLIEMMLVIALSSIVLAAIGIMLNGMWRAQKTMSDQRTSTFGIAHFAQQFREDAHSAFEVSLVEENNGTIRLALNANETIEYLAGNSSIDRTVKRVAVIIRRETYSLPKDALTEWSLEPSDHATLASAKIRFPRLASPVSEVSGQREYIVAAAIGVNNSSGLPEKGQR